MLWDVVRSGNYVEFNDGIVEESDSTAVVEMNAGDVFVIEPPGGGGSGLPAKV
jgi:N-methylhydantoinase B/oxoprolinase/acetone carboxylase alpha subunit